MSENDKPPRRASLGYRPHQVMAIAAALVASSPEMFAGPDALELAHREAWPRDPAPPLPYEMRPQPRALPRERRPRPIVVDTRGGKPAGSKLARKAARGRL
jgi:hypothetical protein